MIAAIAIIIDLTMAAAAGSELLVNQITEVLMKKISCLLLFSTIFLFDLPTVEAKVNTKEATIEVASLKNNIGRKKNRNRKRDGFFRRLFRKNKGCGCPKI